MMHKILFTGPESTGKSQIARQLAAHYGTLWVPEYARTYIEQLQRPYRESDLISIARGQVEAEEKRAREASSFLFCDTGMLVMKVWSMFKYGRCHPWILEQLQARHYSLIVLCGIDTPWTPDPQREHPERREALYNIYRDEIRQLNRPYLELWGNKKERFDQMKTQLNKLSNPSV